MKVHDAIEVPNSFQWYLTCYGIDSPVVIVMF